MLKFNKIKCCRIKPKFKLPKDRLRVEELKTNTNKFEYIVINEAYDNFKKTEMFCTSLTLIFNKESNKNVIDSFQYYNELEFKLKEYIYNKKGRIIFCYRVEKKNLRETLFYIPKKTADLLRINELNKVLNFSNDIEIIIKKDPTWELKSKYIKLYNYERTI